MPHGIYQIPPGIFGGLIMVKFCGRVRFSALCVVEVVGIATQEWPSRVAEEAARGNCNPTHTLALLLLQEDMCITTS